MLATRVGAKPSSAFVIIGTDGALTSARTLTGTSNQITVTDNGAGSTVVLSLPQSIATTSTPTFGTLTLGTATGNTLIVDTTTLVVDATNNRVGIGSASPSVPLHVVCDASGNAFFVVGSGGTLQFTQGGVASTMQIVSSTVPFTIGTSSNATIAGSVVNLAAAGVNALTIINGARIGVGVAAPTSMLHLKAGTATANTAPFQFDSGTIETVARAGVCEYDGVQFYKVIDTTSGRGAVAVEPYVHLTAAGSTISTIANFFGATTNIAIVASAYYIIDVYCWFLNSTAGTVTWTFTNSAAPTSQDVVFEMSPLTGIVAPPGTATMLQGQLYNDTTAALAITTGTLADAVNHYMHARIYLQNSTGTSLKIQATKNVGGTITPGINSYWIARRMSPNNIGTFVA